MSLTDWEKTLSAYCAHVSHLSEIRLPPFDIDQIGQHLKALLRRTQKNQLKEQIERYPSTWIVYMAAIAARNEDRGYWEALATSLGVRSDKLPTTCIGQTFLSAVKQFGLPDYTDVGGYPYVTPIRLHGGIPAYSLPDFFEYILMPAAKDAELADKTPAEQIESLLSRSTVESSVDSPVRNYLRYGGKTAEEFFTACVDMARMFLHDRDLPSPQSLGLPAHVVNAFRDFVEERLQVTPGQKRLRAPRLFLDPFSGFELYRLELPAEPVDADRATWRHEWKICLIGDDTHNCTQTERVRVRRIGYDLTTEPRTVSLEFPPGQVRVELWATAPEEEAAPKPNLIGRWVVSLAPSSGQAPLLAFRAQTGQAIRTDPALPAERLWLLYPRTAQLRLIGEGRCTQQFSELLGDWSEWRIEEWDLSGATTVILEAPGATWPPLVVRSQMQEPRLEGGKRLAEVNNAADAPFYVDEPPRLWLPRLVDLSIEEELKSWRIGVSSRWAAVPELPEPSPHPLLDWRQAVNVRGDSIEFPLSTILGAAPMGLYDVTVEGPHKLRKTMRFYIWPGITIYNWQPYYLPGPHGAETVTFSIRTLPAHRVVVQPGAEGVAVALNEETNRYEVTVASDSSEAPLFLEAPQAQGEMVRLALHIRVARLRWKLTTDDDAGEWSTTPIRLPVDKLIQSRPSHFTIELDAEEWPAYCLILQDAGATDGSLQAGDWRKPQRGQQWLHLPLAEYSDTLRGLMDCPVFAFSLSIRNASTDLRLPLLYLNREPGLTAVLLDWASDGVAYLHWEAQHRLRNRRVRLWSAWQPWTQPYEFPIPDDVAATELSEEPGSGMLALPVNLPRGWHWVALRTAPTWEELSAPPEPTPDALLACDTDADVRLLELEFTNLNSSEHEYLVHFERACILDAMNNDVGCQDEIQWLYEHHALAEPNILYALYRWLLTRDNLTARAIRMHMFAPDKVARILSDDALAFLRKTYMEVFAVTRAVKPESALLIIQSGLFPDLENRALQILLSRQSPKAVIFILNKVSEGALSEQDALALLNNEELAEFALQTLRKQSSSPVRDRIMLELIPLAPTIQFVKPGDWVHTEAGWGKIEKIAFDGQEKRWFDPENETPELGVVLRPTGNPIHVSVSLSSKKIVFPEHVALYQCRKECGCDGFISTWRDDVTYEHNRAAHNGIQPAFRPIDSHEWRWRKAPTFQPQPPDNEFK
jgi:hypothetical protein